MGEVQTIAVDFDGVIHKYGKGWHDGTIYDELMPGALKGIRELQKRYAVYVFTSRHTAPVGLWMIDQGLGPVAIDDGTAEFWNRQDAILVTNRKLPAVAYIDDRVVRFTSWEDVPNQLADGEDWFVNEILKGAPESWDDDAPAEHTAITYVRELERRLDAAGISRNRWAEDEDSQRHVIELRDDGWTIQHPLACRPDLFSCPHNRAALAIHPDRRGQYICTINSEGALEITGKRLDMPGRLK